MAAYMWQMGVFLKTDVYIVVEKSSELASNFVYFYLNDIKIGQASHT